MMRRLLVGAWLVGMIAPATSAQVRPPRPAPAPTPGARADTVRRDTTSADSLIAARLRLSPPDSVMLALLGKPGYTVTRYEGSRVTFDAENQLLEILGGEAKRAIVQRGDSQTVFADTGIFFDQRTKVAIATGTIILHDPKSGQADLFGHGRLEYSLNERSATITNPMFTANTGEQWQIRALKGKMLGDSASGKGSAFYGLGGELTSCTDSVPDYHFKFNEVKRSGSNTLVARPAILYIRDIPVMWLPFMFSDMRPGRHSGLLTPRFGISDIIRNNPSYRRNVENIGYYFAINDYMDASTWMDWRSSAGASEGDPGWMRFNGEWRYNWLDRFLGGNIASSYTRQRDHRTNLAVTWGHQQSFTRDRRFSANVNFVTSTALQRQNTFNPYTALATIRSQVNYSDKIGPAQLQLGGSRTQYPGRPQIDQNLPSLSINTGTLNLARWLSWTPSFSYSASQTLRIDQPGEFSQRYFYNPEKGGALDSASARRNSYSSSTSFDTPLRIFGYDLKNRFSINQQVLGYPQRITLTDVFTGEPLGDRIFPNSFRTDIDWTPDFQLPPIARNLFNITPSVSFSNVTSGPFWVRTNLSNGKFVHQSKRPSFSLSTSPVIYGLFPGLGPFTRFRHTLQPTMSYGYAPRASVNPEYLRAVGRSARGEFSGLQQNSISFGLNQNIEAKVRAPNDTNPEGGEKIKLLSLTFSPLTYDVDRARAAKKSIRGLTTSNFSYSLSSDLLPGFQFQSAYSLFEGDPVSDTAAFKPYLEQISASLNLSRGNNPFAVLTRLFGRAVPADQRPNPSPTPEQTGQRDDTFSRQLASQPVAGSGARGSQFIIPPSQGWTASLTFSSAHPRPIRGGNVVEIDPRRRCEDLARASGDPLLFDACLLQAQLQTTPTAQNPFESGIGGATVYRNPPSTSLGGQFSFSLTDKWATSWNTSYDFVRGEFAQHMVTLQRDLHDWRAVFAFTQSPNGNFAFNFFIALKAEPDLKFDYNKATVRSGTGF